MKNKQWLVYAIVTMLLWGLWGAFTGVSIEKGFPETLVYCVWAITMILPTIVVMTKVGWKIDRSPKAIISGLLVGLLGAGGQMVLFYAVSQGPAYLIFPLIALSPMVTIMLSVTFLRERTNWMGIVGIVLALIAVPMLDYKPGGLAEFGFETWFLLSLIVMICWGAQAFFIRTANSIMSGESIFFYMTLSGLLLMPIAYMMTDFSEPVNWGWDGPWLAAAIQILNAIGALCLVFAFRHGKAILVAPITNAGAPLITAVISLVLLDVIPDQQKTIALTLAAVAAILLAMAPENDQEPG